MDCRIDGNLVSIYIDLQDSSTSLYGGGDEVVDFVDVDHNINTCKTWDESIIIVDVIVDNIACEIMEEVVVVLDIKDDVSVFPAAPTCEIIVNDVAKKIVPPELYL